MRIATLFLALSLWLFATGQFGDVIIYEGKKEQLFTNPLQPYLQERGIKFKGTCSACWRGYQATWEVRDSALYLVRLKECTCRDTDRDIPLSRIARGYPKELMATWYSGELRIPQGKMLQYYHAGYASVYEYDLLLTIREGRVVETKKIRNTKQ